MNNKIVAEECRIRIVSFVNVGCVFLALQQILKS